MTDPLCVAAKRGVDRPTTYANSSSLSCPRQRRWMRCQKVASTEPAILRSSRDTGKATCRLWRYLPGYDNVQTHSTTLEACKVPELTG